MFNPYEEELEQKRFHDSFNFIETPKQIRRYNSGVKPLKSQNPLMSSSMSGGSQKTKRAPSKWNILVKNIMNEKKVNMKGAIKYIKDNNLY